MRKQFLNGIRNEDGKHKHKKRPWQKTSKKMFDSIKLDWFKLYSLKRELL